MAIKTVAQMFGDGAGNGPAVPYSTSNPPGTSAPNRGIQFGEQLTAAIANRTHVALCLNDEDLNTRLVSWETGGLNAAYRLGAVSTPGGGRTINVDAGPVELTANHTTLYSKDRVNAQLRVNHNADTIDGAVGLDVHSEHQAKPFAAALYRHQQDLTSYNIADSDSGTLNVGGANSDRLFMTGGEDVAPLIIGVDQVEILNTAYAGLYNIVQRNPGDPGVSLQTLGGTTPVFAADTAVNFRVWRSMLRTSARNGGSSTVPTGTVLAGTLRFNDSPVLTLVADAEAPYIFGPSDTGARYALQVVDRNMAKKLRINSVGTVQTSDGSFPTDGGAYGWNLGHYHTNNNGNGVAFGAFGGGGFGSGPEDNTMAVYSLMGLENRSNLSASVACVNQFVNLTGFSPCAGAAFHIVPDDDTNSKAGVYFVVDATLAASAMVMEGIDGVQANFVPGNCTVTPLVGLSLGQRNDLLTGPLTVNLPTTGTEALLPDVLSAVRIQSPTQNEDVRNSACLALLNTTADFPERTSYLRCIAPAAGSGSTDDFAIMAGGLVTARGTIRAPEIFATTGLESPSIIATTTLRCATEVTIPGPAASKYRDFTAGIRHAVMNFGGVQQWSITGNPLGPWELFSLVNNGSLFFDITDDLSHLTGDIIMSFRVTPGAARATVGNRVRMHVVAQNISTGASTQLTDNYTSTLEVTDDGTVNPQTLQWLLTGYSMNKQTTRLYVQFRAGNDGGSNIDIITGGQIAQYGQTTPYVRQSHN